LTFLSEILQWLAMWFLAAELEIERPSNLEQSNCDTSAMVIQGLLSIYSMRKAVYSEFNFVFLNLVFELAFDFRLIQPEG
jgi:hypothetical protein